MNNMFLEAMFLQFFLVNLLNKCNDRFSIFLNFDPKKEIIKIRCQIYV